MGDGVPILGGTHLSIEFDPWSRTAVIPPQGDLAEGDCVKITFYGPSGEVIGSTTTEVGEPFEVPEGTEGGKPEPCDPPPPKKKARRSSSPAQFVAQGGPLEQFDFAYLPMDLTDGPYHYAQFSVTAPDRDEADRISDDFILGMLSEAPPLEVEPGGVAEVEVGVDSSVRVSMYSTQQPDRLTFEWNGAALYGLGEAVVSHANGWFVTTVVVPSSLVDIDLLGTSTNSFRYRLGFPSGPEVGTSASVAVTQ